MNIAKAHPVPAQSGPTSASVLGVIPARLHSTRLPRKPLHPIAGRPLVEWVWRRAVEMDQFGAVVVATDSDEVAEAARRFGAEVAMTDAAHPSGTDRVAEVARAERWARFPFIVNVQGDEPFLPAEHVAEAVRLVRDGGWDVGTVACSIASLAELREPSAVKVVRGHDGGAMLFSRAPIPFPRDADPTPAELAAGPWLRHVGVYAYRRDALLRWVAMPEGELERIERLEQLRPLAAGMRIGVGRVSAAEAGVDTPADAARVEAILAGRQSAVA